MNGDDQERELMAVLRGHGFISMRSPGSGTGDWDQPDVLASKYGIGVATELKAGDRPANVKSDEVDALERFADAFWAGAVIAVRYKRDRTFYLVTPVQMSSTPSGNYSIPSDSVDLPWAVALPYTRDDDRGIVPITDDGIPRVLFATADPAPGLGDWLDALITRQQGFRVRQGIIDLKRGVGDD